MGSHTFNTCVLIHPTNTYYTTTELLKKQGTLGFTKPNL